MHFVTENLILKSYNYTTYLTLRWNSDGNDGE